MLLVLLAGCAARSPVVSGQLPVRGGPVDCHLADGWPGAGADGAEERGTAVRQRLAAIVVPDCRFVEPGLAGAGGADARVDAAHRPAGPAAGGLEEPVGARRLVAVSVARRGSGVVAGAGVEEAPTAAGPSAIRPAAAKRGGQTLVLQVTVTDLGSGAELGRARAELAVQRAPRPARGDRLFEHMAAALAACCR